MNWEKKARIACENKGLRILDFEGWYIFAQDDKGRVLPLRECLVAEWVNQL